MAETRLAETRYTEKEELARMDSEPCVCFRYLATMASLWNEWDICNAHQSFQRTVEARPSIERREASIERDHVVGALRSSVHNEFSERLVGMETKEAEASLGTSVQWWVVRAVPTEPSFAHALEPKTVTRKNIKSHQK